VQDLKTILLVEDSPNDVELTLEALANYRLANDIVVVNDGEAALDSLYRRGPFAAREPVSPVVVLLDLKMPKVDGLTVLRSVKAGSGLKCIPIVMLTSSREERDLVETGLQEPRSEQATKRSGCSIIHKLWRASP